MNNLSRTELRRTNRKRKAPEKYKDYFVSVPGFPNGVRHDTTGQPIPSTHLSNEQADLDVDDQQFLTLSPRAQEAILVALPKDAAEELENLREDYQNKNENYNEESLEPPDDDVSHWLDPVDEDYVPSSASDIDEEDYTTSSESSKTALECEEDNHDHKYDSDTNYESDTTEEYLDEEVQPTDDEQEGDCQLLEACKYSKTIAENVEPPPKRLKF